MATHTKRKIKSEQVAEIGVPEGYSIITPSDTVDLADADGNPQPIRALRAEGAGDIKVTMADGTTAVLKWSSGETRYMWITRVWAAGLTATGQLEGGH